MARKEDENQTSSPPIRGIEDLSQNEMFKVLLDQLTIIDEDAKDRRKQIVLSLFNQLALLSKEKIEVDQKLKKAEVLLASKEDLIDILQKHELETKT